MDRAKYLEIRKSENLGIRKFALLQHYLIDGAFVAVIYFTWQIFADSSARFLTIPLVAALIFRNFSLMHESVHKAVSKTPLVSDVIGVIAGAICLLPYEPWRRSHLEHHSWSGNIDKDPVMAIIKFLPKLNPKLQKSLSFFWRLWVPTLSIMQYGVFYFLAAKIFIAKRDSVKILLSLVAPVALWTSAFIFLPTEFSLPVLLPALALYMIAVEVVNFPHHLQLQQFHGETRFAPWEQYKIARTCTYPKWFARLVVLNFNYHIEHHMFPDAPWYHLEKLHLRVRPLLTDHYNSDEQFAWIIENRPKDLADVVRMPNSTQDQPKAA